MSFLWYFFCFFAPVKIGNLCAQISYWFTLSGTICVQDIYRGDFFHPSRFIFAWDTSSPRPCDSNISMQLSQHGWVQPSCCVRLASVLLRVAICWVLLSQNLKMVKFFMQHLWMLHDVIVVWLGSCQQCCAWVCARVRFSNCNMSQHVATGWANACNMLCPTMLGSVESKCCDRLVRACKCWASNVGMCCVEILLSFGRGLRGIFSLSRTTFARDI